MNETRIALPCAPAYCLFQSSMLLSSYLAGASLLLRRVHTYPHTTGVGPYFPGGVDHLGVVTSSHLRRWPDSPSICRRILPYLLHRAQITLREWQPATVFFLPFSYPSSFPLARRNYCRCVVLVMQRRWETGNEILGASTA